MILGDRCHRRISGYRGDSQTSTGGESRSVVVARPGHQVTRLDIVSGGTVPAVGGGVFGARSASDRARGISAVGADEGLRPMADPPPAGTGLVAALRADSRERCTRRRIHPHPGDQRHLSAIRGHARIRRRPQPRLGLPRAWCGASGDGRTGADRDRRDRGVRPRPVRRSLSGGGRGARERVRGRRRPHGLSG